MTDHHPPRERLPIRQRCMFERCTQYGSQVNVDGRHPRVLCANHEGGIRRALESPSTYRVSWGLSSFEKVGRDETQIQAILDQYGEEPVENRGTDRVVWNPDISDEELGNGRRPTDAEEAWRYLESLRANVAMLNEDGYRPPVVRVTVRTT